MIQCQKENKRASVLIQQHPRCRGTEGGAIGKASRSGWGGFFGNR